MKEKSITLFLLYRESSPMPRKLQHDRYNICGNNNANNT